VEPANCVSGGPTRAVITSRSCLTEPLSLLLYQNEAHCPYRFLHFMSFDSLPNITSIFNVGDIMQRTDLKKLVPQPKQYKKGPYTIEAKGYEKKDGETIPRVHPSAKNGLISTPAPDVKTIYDILRSSSKKFGNAKALGYRTLIKTHEETKQIKKVVDGKEVTEDKKWQFSELSSYTYISFDEYEQLCFKVASGYRALGMNKGDRIHIFASTSPWWLATAHGNYTLSPVVSISI
jgi:long-chain acyl-CoA synthetase